MTKAMCISGIIFGVLLIFIFAFDLALKFPFGRPSLALDIGFIVGGLSLAYMGWSALRSSK
jgi:hypothetical protein